MNFFLTFLYCLIFPLCTTIFQVANFPLIPGIKTGDHKAITQRLSANTYCISPQPFFTTFGTIPIVAIGLVVFEV